MVANKAYRPADLYSLWKTPPDNVHTCQIVRELRNAGLPNTMPTQDGALSTANLAHLCFLERCAELCGRSRFSQTKHQRFSATNSLYDPKARNLNHLSSQAFLRRMSRGRDFG